MRFWSTRNLYKIIGILGVFGGAALAALIAGGSVLKDEYWNKCVPTSRYEDAQRLGKVMRFEVPQQATKKTFLERIKDGVHHSEDIRFVGGARIVKPFEGKEQIRVIDYAVNCMYPPFSIISDKDGQHIGNPPYPMPVYCHLPSPSSGNCTPKTHLECTAPGLSVKASPTPTPDCSTPYCPPPTPSPAPAGLAGDRIQAYLQRKEAPKSSLYLQSVGTLKVGSSDPNNPKEFWASGFVIADNVFVTTCHAMEPLFVTDEYGKPDNTGGKYKVRDGIKLFVDFGVGEEYKKPAGQTPIAAEYIDCSAQEGLDVALLSLKGTGVPQKVPVFYDENFIKKVVGRPAALIAYGDLSHPIDQITSEMYAPFVKDSTTGKYWSYRKFAMWDPLLSAARCNKVDYLFDTPSTTVGSSGALVLAIFRDAIQPEEKSHSNTSKELSEPTLNSLAKPLAIGIHTCCSAFFVEQETYNAPAAIPCASLHRTPFNQDVSSKSILEEPRFCRALSDGRVQIEDGEGNPFHLECSDQSVVVKKGPQQP